MSWFMNDLFLACDLVAHHLSQYLDILLQLSLDYHSSQWTLPANNWGGPQQLWLLDPLWYNQPLLLYGIFSILLIELRTHFRNSFVISTVCSCKLIVAWWDLCEGMASLAQSNGSFCNCSTSSLQTSGSP